MCIEFLERITNNKAKFCGPDFMRGPSDSSVCLCFRKNKAHCNFFANARRLTKILIYLIFFLSNVKHKSEQFLRKTYFMNINCMSANAVVTKRKIYLSQTFKHKRHSNIWRIRLRMQYNNNGNIKHCLGCINYM
jgi:hypothetical protein